MQLPFVSRKAHEKEVLRLSEEVRRLRREKNELALEVTTKGAKIKFLAQQIYDRSLARL